MKKLMKLASLFASLRLSDAKLSVEADEPLATCVRVGHRPTATQELEQFSLAWGLSVRDARAVLVFVRCWLHNLLVARGERESGLPPGDAQVLYSYALWLDGIPQVVRRLPDAVLLDDPVAVELVEPLNLPAQIQEVVEALVNEDTAMCMRRLSHPRSQKGCGVTQRSMSLQKRAENPRRVASVEPRSRMRAEPPRTEHGRSRSPAHSSS